MSGARASALVAAALLLGACRTTHNDTQPALASTPELSVIVVLNTLHEAASEADGERYFELFSNDAVFFGTDATERWPIEQFRAYAMQRFATGVGWTYHVTSRQVFFSADGRTAWFDETLHNAGYGVCRGTGVLIVEDDAWKIAQYNLSIPIPNALALDVVDMIRRAE